MKYTTKILLESKNNRSGEVRIRFRVRWENKLAQFLLPYTINPEKWSNESKRCLKSTTHGKHKIQANIINSEIQLYEDSTEKIFCEIFRTKTDPSVEEFKIEFFKLTQQTNKSKLLEPKQKNFFDIYDEFISNQGVLNSWSKATFTKFESIKRHLQNFDKNITFDDLIGVDADMKMQKFILYMQTKEAMQLTFDDAERGMMNTTISKYIDFLKWFLRWASKHNYYTGNLHDTFRPKLKGTDGNNRIIVYLSWNELINLYNFDFREALKDYKENDRNVNQKITSLESVRDVFCFCCFSSLRYSDVAKLKRSDIKDGYISVVTKKTADGLRINLNQYSKSIIDKYNSVTFKKDLVLPVISNATMNEQLKEMAKIAGINEQIRTVFFVGSQRYEEVYPKYELITTHCGRRTFIVNALYLGIPAEVVMNWTGHSDYESMRPYIKIVDELKEESMNKFNK